LSERPESTPAENPAPAAAKAGEVFKRLGPAGPLALVCVTLPVVGAVVLASTMSWVAPWFRSHGGTGVALYVLGFGLLGGLAVLPTWVQAVMGGFAFKAVAGSIAAVAGVLGASLLGYAIARRASGDRVVRLIEEQPKWKAVYDALVGGSRAKTFLIVTLLRVPTNSPFAITNLVMAATRIRPLTYAAGTVLGMAPRTIAAAIIGAGMSEWNPDNARNKWLLIGGIVVTLVVFAIIGMMANRAIQRVTGQTAAASKQAL